MFGISDKLCVPNTQVMCLKNGTIMCISPAWFTSSCDNEINMNCVYSRMECAGQTQCNTVENQPYVEFYLPCISNVTLNQKGVNYELCVTALAEPRKFELPLGALATFLAELGQWRITDMSEQNNSTNSTDTDDNMSEEHNSTNILDDVIINK